MPTLPINVILSKLAAMQHVRYGDCVVPEGLTTAAYHEFKSTAEYIKSYTYQQRIAGVR